MSYASDGSEDSGTQARRSEEVETSWAEWEDVGRASLVAVVADGFCWMRAMKPGMLSFADGVGCT